MMTMLSDDNVEEDRNNDDHNVDQYDLPVMVTEGNPNFSRKVL